jgi:rubredoxin
MNEKSQYVPVTVECPECHTKQVVHMAASVGFSQMGPQNISCAKCNFVFEKAMPAQIIAGPFLATGETA